MFGETKTPDPTSGAEDVDDTRCWSNGPATFYHIQEDSLSLYFSDICQVEWTSEVLKTTFELVVNAEGEKKLLHKTLLDTLQNIKKGSFYKPDFIFLEQSCQTCRVYRL